MRGRPATLESARAEFELALLEQPPRARTQHAGIKLTRAHEGSSLPPKVIYIGRDYGGHKAGALANRWRVKDMGIERAVGAFMRELAELVARRDARTLEGLREIEPTSTLACWCCSRPAELLWSGPGLPEHPCHGDAVASMHEALTDEGVLGGGREIGSTAFTASACLLFGRAFGVSRVIASRRRREGTDAWLASQGRPAIVRKLNATMARACEDCNGGGRGCSRCAGSGFEPETLRSGDIVTGGRAR